jgi:hypothetical protein
MGLERLRFQSQSSMMAEANTEPIQVDIDDRAEAMNQLQFHALCHTH